MADKSLNVILRVRNELRRGFAAAGADVRRFQQSVGRGGMPWAEGLAKGLAVMGTVEGAMKGVTALSAAFRGDWDAAAEAVKTLPMGIGAAATAMEGLLGEVLGINEAVAELNREAAALALTAAKSRASVAQRRQLDLVNEALQRQIDLQRVGAQERERLMIRHAAQQARQRAEAQREGAAQRYGRGTSGFRGVSARLDRQIALIDERMVAQLAAVEKRERVKAGEELDAEIERRDKSWRAMRVEANVKELRLLGLNLAAQITMIREHYRQRAVVAKSGAEREQLGRLEGLDIALARKAAQRAPGQAAHTGGVAVQLLTQRRHDIMGLERTAAGVKKSNQLLQQILNRMPEPGQDNQFLMVG